MATVAELYMQQARLVGDRKRRKGEIVGGLVSDLSQMPAQILAQRTASRQAEQAQRVAADERKRKAEHDAATLAQGDARIGLDRNKFSAEQDATQRTQQAEQRAKEVMQAWVQQHEASLGPERASGILAALEIPGEAAKAAQALMKAPEPFTLNPGDKRFDASGKQIADNPKPVEAPAPDARPLNAQLADAIKKGDMQGATAIRRAIREAAAAGRDPSGPSNPLATQTEWAIAPGETEARLMTKDEIRQLGAKRPAGADKPSSGQQKRVLNFFNRAKQADEDLEKLEPGIAEMGLAGQTWQALAPNFLQSEQGQLYTQAQRAFTEARLRKDSGAAIPDHEFDSDRQTYFVQPGDDAATLAQKRRARAAMLASLGFESGQALAEFVGNPDEAKAIVDGYKQRAAKAEVGGAAPKEGATKPIPGYPGTEQTFTNGKWIRTK